MAAMRERRRLKGRGTPERTLARLARLASVLTAPFVRYELRGGACAPDVEVAIIVCNHRSLFDVAAGLICLDRFDRYPRMLIAREYVLDEWTAPFARAIGAIPVDRRGTRGAALAPAVATLAAGHDVLIMPEGRLHWDPEDPALEVPERHVDDAEEPDRELLRPVELPEPMPEPFAPVGALTDEFVSQNPVDDVGQHRPAPLVVGLANRAALGRNAKDGGCTRTVRAAQAVPPSERRRNGRERDQVDINRGDSHRVIIIRMMIRCQATHSNAEKASRVEVEAGAVARLGEAVVSALGPRRIDMSGCASGGELTVACGQRLVNGPMLGDCALERRTCAGRA